MRPNPRSLLLAAALLAPAAVLTAGCGDSDSASPPPAAKAATPDAGGSAAGAPSTRATLQSKLQGVVDAGSPGVIALVNDGDGVQLHAAGVADTRSGRVLRPTDRFRAGSNTKSFVATVVLQLVAEGKLSLDDTVDHWLPDILPYGEKVNLRQLLNMTSGIPDYVPELEAEMVEDRTSRTRTYTPRDLVARVADQEPDFAPATSWNYSSTGTILVGLIIERATGQRLGEEIEQRILEPLRLRHTSFLGDTTAMGARHADGYGLVDGELRDLTAFNASAAWAAGAIETTASDLARYWRALLRGKLLAPAQLEAMKATVLIKEGLPLRYGLGIMEWKTSCGTFFGHGGDLPGFSSEFVNSEDGEHQAGVVINVRPTPDAVAGEPLGAAKATARADAVGRAYC